MYFVEEFLQFVDVASELKGLELQLFEALHYEEVEDLLGYQVAEIPHDQFIVSVDAFPQLVSKGIAQRFVLFLLVVLI